MLFIVIKIQGIISTMEGILKSLIDIAHVHDKKSLLSIFYPHDILDKYNWIRKRMQFRSPSSLEKEGDAHDHNGSPDFTISDYCGFDLFR